MDVSPNSLKKNHLRGIMEEKYYPLGSLALNLKPLYPHLRQVLAVGGFRALHLRQILILNILFSASSNLAII